MTALANNPIICSKWGIDGDVVNPEARRIINIIINIPFLANNRDYDPRDINMMTLKQRHVVGEDELAHQINNMMLVLGHRIDIDIGFQV